MERSRLADSGERGWFIGSFDRAFLKTGDFEVAYQFSPAGHVTRAHVHKVATEINLIASGKCLINGELYSTGDLLRVDPGEAIEVVYIEDTFSVCVKVPSILGDKYQL